MGEDGKGLNSFTVCRFGFLSFPGLLRYRGLGQDVDGCGALWSAGEGDATSYSSSQFASQGGKKGRAGKAGSRLLSRRERTRTVGAC